MNKLFFIIAFSILSISVSAQNHNITVKVTGLKNVKGNISIGLYNNPEKFPEQGQAYKGVDTTITNEDFSYTFKSINKGTYAVAIYHDENSNHELDKNFFGIPSEGYGFSNDASGTIGAPDFEDASVVVDADQTITITLKY